MFQTLCHGDLVILDILDISHFWFWKVNLLKCYCVSTHVEHPVLLQRDVLAEDQDTILRGLIS